MFCLVGVTKNCEQALLILATSYSYSNDCSPFHEFYTDLKILQNCKRIGSEKNLKVVYNGKMTWAYIVA